MVQRVLVSERDDPSRRVVSRRDFLRIGGASVAGITITLAFGCTAAGGQSESASGVPDPLTIGVIPSEDTQDVAAAFEPVADHVGGQLGVDAELYTATDYSGIIEAMRSGEADVAWLGPLSYVLASERANAEAIAVQLTEEGSQNPTYQSYIITAADSDVRELTDLEDKNFAFVDPTSTSGNLFPRKGLTEAGINPDEDLAETTYAGGHDASALAVANGDVAAGAVASNTFESMVSEGALDKSQVRIIWKSEPIPESPVAVRGDLSAGAKRKIKQTFLEIKPEDIGKEQISPDGAIGYVEAQDSDYDVIRELAESLDLSGEQLAS